MILASPEHDFAEPQSDPLFSRQSSTNDPSPRLISLDVLRGMAIFLVLMHHGFCWTSSVLSAREMQLLPVKCWLFCAEWSDKGVTLFFVLSGFLITGILRSEKSHSAKTYFGNFYLKRALRIFPVFYIYLAIVFGALPHLCHDPILAELQKNWVFYALYLGNFSILLRNTPGNMFLFHTWSLSVEEQFYFIWPLLIRFTPKDKLVVLFWSVIAIANCSMIASCTLGYTLFNAKLISPCVFDSFAVGALLQMAYLKGMRCSDKVCFTALGICAATAAVLTKSSNPFLLTLVGNIIGVIASASLLQLALNDRGVSTFWRSMVLQRFGKYSYAIYLFHFPIVYFLYHYDLGLVRIGYDPLFVWFAQFALIVLLAYTAGVISFYSIEKYCFQLKRFVRC